MKGRTVLYTLLSLLFAAFFIVCATAFQTNYSQDPAEWLRAHRQIPILWLVDSCAVYTLLLMTFLISYERMARQRAEEVLQMREENRNRWDEMIVQSEEIERLNRLYEARVEELEKADQERQALFEEESRRLHEQAFQALQGQVEANTRQMEAINMAMQYHRAEIKSLRHTMRDREDLEETLARLSESLPAVDQVLSITSAESASAVVPVTDSTSQQMVVGSDSGTGELDPALAFAVESRGDLLRRRRKQNPDKSQEKSASEEESHGWAVTGNAGDSETTGTDSANPENREPLVFSDGITEEESDALMTSLSTWRVKM
jgi:hypothetical protein